MGAYEHIIKPEIADQVSVGYFKNLKDNMYEFSAETYYNTCNTRWIIKTVQMC